MRIKTLKKKKTPVYNYTCIYLIEGTMRPLHLAVFENEDVVKLWECAFYLQPLTSTQYRVPDGVYSQMVMEDYG